MTDLRDSTFHLIDFLPESIASDEFAVPLAAALTEQLRDIANAAKQANVLPRLAEMDLGITGAPTLNAVAADYRFHEWRLWNECTDGSKREFLAGVVGFLRRSGTTYAVKQQFALLNWNYTLTEWFDDSASLAPGTYRILIHGVSETTDRRRGVIEWCERFGAADSLLLSLAFV